MTRKRGREKCIQQRVARKIHGKVVIWMGRMPIQMGVLEKIRRKLAVMEKKSICKNKPQSVFTDKAKGG